MDHVSYTPPLRWLSYSHKQFFSSLDQVENELSFVCAVLPTHTHVTGLHSSWVIASMCELLIDSVFLFSILRVALKYHNL